MERTSDQVVGNRLKIAYSNVEMAVWTLPTAVAPKKRTIVTNVFKTVRIS